MVPLYVSVNLSETIYVSMASMVPVYVSVNLSETIYESMTSMVPVYVSVNLSETIYVSMSSMVPVYVSVNSSPITDGYQRSPAFTQRSSGAIQVTTDDYQRFLKRHRTLTRTLWCDGALNVC